jgi:hypothetical protein
MKGEINTFKLTHDETANLRSQFVTSSWGGARYQSLAFTEQGLAMLSGLLNSNDINEMQEQTNLDVSMQLELVSFSLAELQSTVRQSTTDAPSHPIGFRVKE